MTREEKIKEAASLAECEMYCSTCPKSADRIDGFGILYRCNCPFILGAQWADSHPVNSWHDLITNPKDLPFLYTKVEVCYISPQDGAKRYDSDMYVNIYRKKGPQWSSNRFIIAWKELDKFNE